MAVLPVCTVRVRLKLAFLAYFVYGFSPRLGKALLFRCVVVEASAK